MRILKFFNFLRGHDIFIQSLIDLKIKVAHEKCRFFLLWPLLLIRVTYIFIHYIVCLVLFIVKKVQVPFLRKTAFQYFSQLSLILVHIILGTKYALSTFIHTYFIVCILFIHKTPCFMIYFLCKTDENVIQEMFGICQLNCLPLAKMPLLRDIKKEL